MNINIAFGIRTVESLLNKTNDNIIIKNIFISKEYSALFTKKIHFYNKSNASIYRVSNKFLDRKLNHHNHQGIMVEYYYNKQIRSYKDLKYIILHNNINFILIMENVNDPRNLGAALRTADCAGIKIVIITKYNTAPINNAIVQKTATSITENISLFKVSNLLRVIFLLKKHNFVIIGTSPKVKNNQNLFLHKFNFPMAILFGSEEKGLSNLILNHCDCIIYIPMFGQIKSLNISVSIGIILYEINRQYYQLNNV